jgi:4'-phosphopantetheinyl transferase
MTCLPQAAELPGEDEVHLWIFRLDPGPTDGELLAPCERARAERFHFQRDRDRFIAGRGRLRRILGAYLQQSPNLLQFCYGASGKPAVAGPLSFNLSHSGEFAALAVARFGLGVDIECVRPIEEAVAERFFAADEVARLRRLPETQQTEAFFACWTRKEAYVKALGDGLSLPLDCFSVSLEPQESARLLRAGNDPAEPSRWQFHHFVPAPGFVGAIAARRRSWRVRRLPAEP